MWKKTKHWVAELSVLKKICLGFATFFVAMTALGAVLPPSNSTDANRTKTTATQDFAKKLTSSDTTETRHLTEIQPVAYSTSRENDAAMLVGTEKTLVKGVNGERTITYDALYRGGVEITRTKVSDVVTKQPVNEEIAVGIMTASSSSSNSSFSSGSSGSSSSCSGGYINSAGDCVKSPGSSSSGATAKCRDGSYSYSQSRSGTCSHHGGVAQWL